MSVRIDEVAEVIRGVTFDKRECRDDAAPNFVPILRAGNIGDELDTTRDLIWVPAERVSRVQIMQPGDLAICMSSGSASVVGKSAALRSSWCGSVGAFCALVRPRTSRVLPEYLGYYLRSSVFRAWAQRSQGANIKNIRKSDLEAFPVPPRPLDEQARLVDLLTRAESIVRLRREAAAKAAELIPAMFVDMVGDPATNPKGWPARRLGDLVQVISGGTPAKTRPEFWEGDVPWVSPKDMKRDEIADAMDHVSQNVLTETNLKLVPADSVLVVVRGMILAHTVPVALTRVPVTINQDMKALRPADCVTALFLQWSLKVAHAKLLGSVSTAAHGTKKLDTEALMAMPVLLPPLALQGQFERHAKAVRSIVAQQHEAMTKAQATFDALLAQAFAPAAG